MWPVNSMDFRVKLLIDDMYEWMKVTCIMLKVCKSLSFENVAWVLTLTTHQ